MPQQTIGIGTSPNDGTGDPLRTAFNKTNSNFTELYTGKLDTTALTSPGPIGSTTASSGAFTTLSASSTVSGNGFTSLFASPPAIGSTTPGTGAFTTLQLGTGGPLFRNNAGTIEARNATNSAAAPLSVSTLTVNGGLYTRQQSVPSSPVTGQRWDEIDGSGLHIQSWFWNGTYWLSQQVFRLNSPYYSGVNSLHFQGAYQWSITNEGWQGIYVEALSVRIRPDVAWSPGGATDSTTNFWTWDLYHYFPATLIASTSSLLTTQNTTATVNGSIQLHDTTKRAVPTFFANAREAFGLYGFKNGTANISITFTHSMAYRILR